MRRHREFLRLIVEANHAHRRAETYPVADVRLLDAALDVIPEHGARRIGGDRLAEMLLEGIIGEFEAFLRAVRPEVAIHAAMDRLAIFVEAGAPGIVPEAPPIRLLFEADDLRDFGALLGGRLKGAQLRQPGRTGTDDGYSCHEAFPS
ncbi:hypothetical protein CUJ84_pRLN2000510 (plasmid) [Rhizobium leguminosarum]|uniref:Uncharacterized protein n=1 Tax=Rhizobium leguminosarum TaxID=384 RepID=A0A2K9ZFR1_RHILE|nr:hypothetical protein CUJ84_pRLN2000510 [Rhizobium leguminosarum]